MTVQAVTELAEEEQIEGLVDDETLGDAYPIDTLLIRNEARTVYEVIRRIGRGDYIMDPDFQRDFIWDEAKQSKLIESVLMRIPLPVFYLAEDHDGRMIVVDGLQRLSTFERFHANNLRLRLPDRPAFDGKTFEELDSTFKNRIEDFNLILYVVDAKAPDRTRLDIFERVNGGVPLTRQQMRNCLYMGDATRFLREESQTELFRDATGRSLRAQTMRDREFVNRFCAFQILDRNDYRDMDEFLASVLRTLNDAPEMLDALREQFRTSLENNRHLFGRHAFRKHEPEQEYRNVINASLWDVMSTGLSRYPEQLVRARAEEVRGATYDLLAREDFQYSITYATNGVKQVHERFEMAHSMLEDVLGAHPA